MQKNNNSVLFLTSMPVLFLVFNRMKTTKLVFEKIKQARPPRIYIGSDGPRDLVLDEDEKVKEIREYLITNIDWECEVYTKFNDSNEGCKKAVSNAINWFFDNEKMGIVLEDDCLPSNSFFRYCEDLLYKYEQDERIFLITGYNKQNEWNSGRHDYFFSNLGGIWGWASWRRAWNHYDVDIQDINNFISHDGFTKSLGKSLGKLKQDMIYNNVIRDNVDTWAMQWGYARHKNNALTCIPALSLIKNIGFGENATHTHGENLDGVEANEIEFPLSDNPFVISDEFYDELLFKKPDLWSRAKNRLKKFKFKFLNQKIN